MFILLIICFFVPFIYFGYLISKLGKYFENNAITIADNTKPMGAVVLGETELAGKVVELLENKGFCVMSLSDPFQLIHDRKLCYLFALSANDADNIAFCKIGRKLYCIEKMISICNDTRNIHMFSVEGINYILIEKVSAEKLLQAVLQQPGASL